MSDQKTDASFSFLDLPDDELDKYQPTEGAGNAAPGQEQNTEGTGAVDEAKGQATGEAGGEGAAAEEQAQGQGQQEGQNDGQAGAENPGSSDSMGESKPAEAKEQKPAEGAPKPEAKANNDTSAIDYEAAYKRVMAPFKANGRDITPSSVEDVVALMQMGANYNKKMAAIKPNLEMLKLLEQNGLLAPEKINFLIDLNNKVPGAVTKLIKDSGLDPLDLGAEKAEGYTPTARKVDPREMQLDTVLDELQDSPSYGRTVSVVKDWDAASKQVVADSPSLLKLINAHIEAGVYDLVVAEIERERVFGRLSGVSDFEAYKQVGDAIHARGGFNHLGRQGQSNPPAVVVKTSTSAADEAKRKEMKKEAGLSKPAPASSNKPAADFNPLAMSDEDFAQLEKTNRFA